VSEETARERKQHAGAESLAKCVWSEGGPC
jgi:hypothetical protein